MTKLLRGRGEPTIFIGIWCPLQGRNSQAAIYTQSKASGSGAIGHGGKAAAPALLYRHAPITLPLNSYAYAHRWVLLSTLTREDSFLQWSAVIAENHNWLKSWEQMTVECTETPIPHTPVLRDYPERNTGKNRRDEWRREELRGVAWRRGMLTSGMEEWCGVLTPRRKCGVACWLPGGKSGIQEGRAAA